MKTAKTFIPAHTGDRNVAPEGSRMTEAHDVDPASAPSGAPTGSDMRDEALRHIDGIPLAATLGRTDWSGVDPAGQPSEFVPPKGRDRVGEEALRLDCLKLAVSMRSAEFPDPRRLADAFVAYVKRGSRPAPSQSPAAAAVEPQAAPQSGEGA